MGPVAGRDYPTSYGELRAWFADDGACLDYLDWLRWPSGFICPRCASVVGWRTGDGRWSCGGCRRRVSATAGTIFHRTRTPLTVWFAAAWQMTSQKQGVSALGMQRVLGMGSYQTAWAMLHRFRSVMVRRGQGRLDGQVEIDETFMGGARPGRYGRSRSEQLVAVAVERLPRKGFGRARLAVVPDASAGSLRELLLDHVEPGATVITDGWISYPKAIGTDYTHEPFNVSASGLTADVPLPGVHRIASLAKRWLLGTHQGAVDPAHLQSYLDEFVFRFNRRTSRARGLLFHRLLQEAVAGAPVTYRELVANPLPKQQPPHPPPGPRSNPASLDLGDAGRPWRDPP